MVRRAALTWILAAALSGTGTVARAAKAPRLTDVWQQVTSYMTKEARWTLQHLPPPSGPAAKRERDFCDAVVLLNQQPLNESRLDEVDRRLQALRKERSDDEIGRASLYLLGRCAQIYHQPAEPDRAARYYRELIETPGGGHWAEMARAKLALLVLYVLPAGSPSERLAGADRLLGGAREPLIRRDLHVIIGRAVLFYNLAPSRALAHFRAADAIGGLTGHVAENVLVELGELSWETGHRQLARGYYQRLLTEFPRDERGYIARRRLAGKPTPPRGEFDR